MDNIEEKLKNLEEWNEERAKVKPFIDIAVDYHSRALMESRWKNYEQASRLYREAIVNYRKAISQNPKYYLRDLLERVDHVIEEHIRNSFNLKTSGDKLKDEKSIAEFIDFIDNLGLEERRYLDNYNIAMACLQVGDFYSSNKNSKRATEFYNRVIDTSCNRPFIERDAHFKIGKLLFDEKKFKEALVSFVSVLSFDRGDKEVIRHIENCLKKLGISEYKNKFIKASPNEATKLIREVL